MIDILLTFPGIDTGKALVIDTCLKLPHALYLRIYVSEYQPTHAVQFRLKVLKHSLFYGNCTRQL